MRDSRADGPSPVVAALSKKLLDRVDEIAASLAQQTMKEVPAYRAAVPMEDLRETTTANLAALLGRMCGAASSDIDAPVITGKRRAVQGVPLHEVLHSFRIGGLYIWRELVDAAEGNQETVVELGAAASEMWAIVDEFSQVIGDAYRETIAEQSRADASVRRALLEALLDGRLGDGSALWECAETLGLPPHGSFVVVAAETAQAGREALPGVEAKLRRRDVRFAWLTRFGHQLGVVTLTPRFGIDALCAELLELSTGRIGVSDTFDTLQHTTDALRHAKLACAAATPRTRDLVRYEQAPLAVFVANAPEAALTLARTVLGPVLDLPSESRDPLLDALRAWFAAGGSAADAAETLFCHPNTIRYRLRRITALTGRQLSDPGMLAELHVALEAVRITEVD
jgi:hypothetical protein